MGPWWLTPPRSVGATSVGVGFSFSIPGQSGYLSFMLPRIALNSNRYDIGPEGGSIHVKTNFPDAILRAGGAPFVIPLTDDPEVLSHLIAQADGVMMLGGFDMPARRFGSEQSALAETMLPRREAPALRLQARSHLPVPVGR